MVITIPIIVIIFYTMALERNAAHWTVRKISEEIVLGGQKDIGRDCPGRSERYQTRLSWTSQKDIALHSGFILQILCESITQWLHTTNIV